MAPPPCPSPGRFNLYSALTKLTLLGLALLAVIYFDMVSPSLLAHLLVHPRTALLSLLIILASAQLNVLRWYLLLRIQGCPLGFGRVWQISYISYFFSTFLPGAIGGDALRAYYVSREGHDTRAHAFLTIVFDRILGLLGLLILGILFAAFDLPKILAQPLLASLFYVCLGVLVVLMATIPLAATLHRAGLFQAFGTSQPLQRLIALVMEAIENYRGFPLRTGLCLGLSVITHAMVAAGMVVIALSFNLPALSPTDLGLASTLAVLANHIPLTPGGLAIGEASFATICGLLAPAHATAGYGSVIFASRLITILSTLPGALALLIFRHPPQAAAETLASAESTRSTPASSRPG